MNSIMSIVRGISLLKAETSESPSDEAKSDTTKVLFVGWNQNFTRFIVGTDKGFNAYSCTPIKEIDTLNTLKSGFKIGETLFDSQYFALVGNGCNSSKYPRSKVFIWDDLANKVHSKLDFGSEVIAVKLREDYIVVVLRQNIYVYFVDFLKLKLKVDTIRNPRGLCCVSYDEPNTILACPGFRPGQVQVHDIERKRIKLIKAHDSEIACMTMTLDGSLLATASTKGTLIRVFNALDGTFLQELRRGIERAEIYSLAISLNLKWVAASSDKGTIHVFRLRPNILSISTDINPASSSSSLTFIRGFLPKYLYDNERSFAQFSLPASTKFIVGFGSDKIPISDGQIRLKSVGNGCSLENTVLVVGVDGSFRRCSFKEEGGQMVELEHKRFFSLPETEIDVM